MKFFRGKESVQEVAPETNLDTENFDIALSELRKKINHVSLRKRLEDFLKLSALVSGIGIGGVAVHEVAAHQFNNRKQTITEESPSSATTEQEDAYSDREFLRKKLGVEFLALLDSAEPKFYSENLISESPETAVPPEWDIQDFDKMGIENNAIRRIVYETFPSGWIDENVAVIKYSGEEISVPKEYNMQAQAIATCANRVGAGLAEIVYGKAAIGKDLNFLFNTTISHEMAHAVDPLGHGSLSGDERANFFAKLIESFESVDRTAFYYIDAINNADKKLELRNKLIEYWAEIFEVYLEDPQKAEITLSTKEVALIKDFVRRTSSGFDLTAAAHKRQAMIEQLYSFFESTTP